MNRFLLRKLSSFLLSVVLAFSISLAAYGITSVVMLRSETLYEKYVTAYSEQFKNDLANELTNQMPDDKVPTSAFIDALDDGALRFLIKKSAANVVSQNRNDFAYSEDLFNLINNSVKKYVDENNVRISDSELSALVSLSVDIINGFVINNDVTRIYQFKYAQSNRAVVIMAVSFVLAIVCAISLRYVNKGRHKMYSYYGMSLASAGYLEIFVPLFAIKTGMVSNHAASGYAVFDAAAVDEATMFLHLQMIIGVVLLAAGLITLVMNYRYLKNKTDQIKTQREINSKIKDEYMEHYNSKIPKQEPVDPNKKEVMKIDF